MIKLSTFFCLLVTLTTIEIANAQIEIDRPEKSYLENKKIYQGYSDEYTGILSLHGNYEINSNTLTNSFIKAILFKGFISDKEKDDVERKFKSVNRGGLDFNVGITGTQHLQDWTLIAGLSYKEHLDLRFPGDLFKVLFRGNKGFAGKTAALGKTEINYFTYQNLFLGFSKEVEAHNIIFGAGISIIRGGQFQKIQLSKAQLFTEESGEFLSLETDFQFDFNQKQNSTLASSGLGTAIQLSLIRNGDKGRWSTEIRDLGFIRWKDMNTVKADSTYRYDGKEINNILNYENYSFKTINADTIRNQFKIGKNIRNFSRVLPFSFNINYTHYLSEKLHLMGGVRYLAFANYFPKLYVRGMYHLKERFILSPALMYGGYGNLNFELSATKSFNDKFIISGSIIGLEYLVLPAYTTGLAIQLNLTKVF